jgi:hypothetical protein
LVGQPYLTGLGKSARQPSAIGSKVQIRLLISPHPCSSGCCCSEGGWGRWLLLAVLLWPLEDGTFILFRVGGRFRDLFEASFIEGWAKANIDGETLARATFVDAAHGRHITIVASVGNTNVTKFDGLSQGGIETDPAASGQENLYPGMRSLAADDFLLLGTGPGAAGYEIAGNITSGKSPHADGTEQDVSEILADAGA